MNELQKLLENAGLKEAEFNSRDHVSRSQALDWGDELIEDLKLLISETPSGKITHEELQAVIQQYEA